MTSRDTYDIKAYEAEIAFNAKHEERISYLEKELLSLKKQIAETYIQVGVAVPKTFKEKD